MTFSQPFSGVFAYKGTIPSAAMNAINNDIPNALDKTGDNASNGGGISGEIDVLNGGSIQFNTGSNLITGLNSTSNFNGLAFFNGTVGFTTTSVVTSSNIFNFTNTSHTTFQNGSQLFVGQSSGSSSSLVLFESTAIVTVLPGVAWAFENTNTTFTTGSISTVQGQFNVSGTQASLNFSSNGACAFGSNTSLTQDALATFVLNGLTTVNSGANLNVGNNGTLNFTNGSSVIGLSGSNMFFESGSDVTFNNNSSLVVNNTNAGSFNIANFPTFLTSQSTNTVQAITAGHNYGNGSGGTSTFLQSNIPYGKIQGQAASGICTWWCPIEVHNGATLASITFNFSLVQGRTNIPGTPPIFDVRRIQYNDNTDSGQSLNSTGGQIMTFSPNTAAGYEATTSFTFIPNQNNIIDINPSGGGGYLYVVVIIDEQGANTVNGNLFGSIVCNFTNINSSGWANV